MQKRNIDTLVHYLKVFLVCGGMVLSYSLNSLALSDSSNANLSIITLPQKNLYKQLPDNSTQLEQLGIKLDHLLLKQIRKNNSPVLIQKQLMDISKYKKEKRLCVHEFVNNFIPLRCYQFIKALKNLDIIPQKKFFRLKNQLNSYCENREEMSFKVFRWNEIHQIRSETSKPCWTKVINFTSLQRYKAGESERFFKNIQIESPRSRSTLK